MKKCNWFIKSVLCTCLGVSLVACNEEDPVPEEPTPDTEQSATGVYFLNAGNWKSNNATLDYYNPETGVLSPKVFVSLNGR